MIADEASLLAEIARSPRDDAPRRVYADWLLERGEARGELIHVQCELASAPTESLRARERALLEQHQARWFGPAFHPAIEWQFDRGFPTGRFGHRGLFVSHSEAGVLGCLRFWPDGVVIAQGVGNAVLDQPTARRICRWFNHDFGNRGQYQVAFEPGRASVTFLCKEEDVGVEFEGALLGPSFELKTHSHINGHRGLLRYELFDLADVTTLGSASPR